MARTGKTPGPPRRGPRGPAGAALVGCCSVGLGFKLRCSRWYRWFNSQLEKGTPRDANRSAGRPEAPLTAGPALGRAAARMPPPGRRMDGPRVNLIPTRSRGNLPAMRAGMSHRIWVRSDPRSWPVRLPEVPGPGASKSSHRFAHGLVTRLTRSGSTRQTGNRALAAQQR